MRIFITGAAGMLGAAVCRQLAGQHELITPTRAELDITDEAAVWRWLREWRPGVVIHLAALTDVDRCQREPELAYRVNAQATATLAAACREVGANLIFLSSIAVFNGRHTRPYLEADAPDPANVYGRSKWQAEQAITAISYETNSRLSASFAYYVIRSGWLFGGGQRDKKFVQLILRLAGEQSTIPVVADKAGSPTYVKDLAQGLERLLTAGLPSGVYHLVNNGPPVSRYELAQTIVRMRGLDVAIRPVTSGYFPNLAPRPAMEAASTLYLTDWLRPWPEALAEYLAMNNS
ncbi:MAG: dTDP-4-dehydrorhamnose reductase [Chloroflexota bacterium]